MRTLTIANDNSAMIIPFPAARRVDVVRRAADAINARDGLQADRYWRQMIMTMRTQLVASGMPDDSVEGELRAFSDSVFSTISERCA